MGRTILLSSPRKTWKEWLHLHRGSRDLICADPGDASLGTPARLARYRGDRPVDSRFLGWLNPAKAPSAWLAALTDLLRDTPDDALIQLFPYRPNPANLELVQLAFDIVRPTDAIFDSEAEIAYQGWPFGPQLVELQDGHLPNLQGALRKAQWLRLNQMSDLHEVPLAGLQFRGARLGSGRLLAKEELIAAGLGQSLRGEICGPTLFIVSSEPVDDAHIGRALDMTHATKALVAHPASYENLLCAFVDGSGRELGMGRICRIDFDSGTLHARVAAVAPAPVAIVKIGGLLVDDDGRELGEAKLWEV